VAVLGPTGAGKSTQARMLAQRQGWHYISSGDLLRASQDPDVQERLASGELATPDEINGMIAAALEHFTDGETVVLDGFPRMLSEAQWLEQFLGQHGSAVQKVLEINVPLTLAMERLAHRHRGDDGLAIVGRKHEWYRRDVAKVLEHYRQQGLLQMIDGRPAPEVVADKVQEVFNGAKT
jgi:adenylate kinase